MAQEPVTISYMILKKELEETRLALENVRRAWQEEHDARVGAEEARDAVAQAAEDARLEAGESKKKYDLRLQEAHKSTRLALEAKRLYDRARAEAEEMKRIWSEARHARPGRRSDILEAEAHEQEGRMVYIENSAYPRAKEAVDTVNKLIS